LAEIGSEGVEGFICGNIVWVNSSEEVSPLHIGGKGLQALVGEDGVFEMVLYHTTRYPDFFFWWDILHFPSDFIFGFLADRAGIEDDDVSFFFGFGIGKSAVDENGFYSGGIRIVHLASECDDVERGHRGSIQIW
jgi:hypothetical protein